MNSQVLELDRFDKKLERIERKLLHYTAKAIQRYQMIQNDDRILVCLSGGKDSYTLLSLLEHIRRRQRKKFELLAFTLDQGQPGWDDTGLRAYLNARSIPFEVLKQDTYSVVIDKIPENKTYCALCSRLRRGIIYDYAKRHGFNKIALGHHRDDLIRTFLMSACYSGEIRSMPPKLLSDDKQHIVIRPLSFCQEADIKIYARFKKFPIIPCNLCGSQTNLARQRIARTIDELTAQNPKVPSNLLHALSAVRPSQLMDRTLWDFAELDNQQLPAVLDAPSVEPEPLELF